MPCSKRATICGNSKMSLVRNLLIIVLPSALFLVVLAAIDLRMPSGRPGRTLGKLLLHLSVGMLAAVVALPLSRLVHLLNPFAGAWSRLWRQFIAVAMMEEAIKLATLRLILPLRSRDEVANDLPRMAIVVALGFAFLENCLQLHQSSQILLLRATVTVGVHVMATRVAALSLVRPVAGYDAHADARRSLWRKPIGIIPAIAGAILIHGLYNLILEDI